MSNFNSQTPEAANPNPKNFEAKIRNQKDLAIDILCELAGSAILAFATNNVAIAGEFPLAGFNGIALLFYRWFGLPIGAMMIVLNVVPALLAWRIMGKSFVLRTLRCMLMSSIMVDYLAPLFPVYTGSRMLAALAAGVLYGIGYAIIYARGSSTGGSDFIMIVLKHFFPHIQTGTISFVLDFGVVVGTGLLMGDVDGIILGLVVNYLMAAVIDKIILGMNAGNVAMIITDHSQEIARLVDRVADRGCTIFHAEGGFNGAPHDMVLVAGSTRDIFRVCQAVKREDPASFTIVTASSEVNGEGFKVTRVGE